MMRTGRWLIVSQRLRACAALLVLSAAAGCGSQREPADNLIGGIDSLLAAASADAAAYVPDRLAWVREERDRLKSSFDHGDYAAVVSNAAPVMAAAHGLAVEAAAKKAQIDAALNERWTLLAAALPDDVDALRSRIEYLKRRSSRTLAAGIDIRAAAGNLTSATSLWSKAQAAFASGNLREAVITVDKVQTALETLAAMLKMNLPVAPVIPAA